MLRKFTVKKDSSLDDLQASLLKAKSRNHEAEAALEQIRCLNPHVDPERIKAGTTLVIPESSDLKVAAGEPVAAAPWGAFKTVVQGALGDVARSASSGREARAAERANATKVLNSAAFKKALCDTDVTDAQAGEVAKSLKAQEGTDREAAETLAATSEAVLGALGELDRIIAGLRGGDSAAGSD
jgi:hypothetical protein